jgi:anti-sigma-K factor RskA
MTHDHDRYGQWAAAYTLGALDADDRRAFETHMATCSLCATELAALAPLPALIAKADPDDVERLPVPAQAAAIAATARQEMRAIQRRARWWQAVAAGVAAASIAVIATLVVDGNDGADRPATQTATVISSTAATTDVSVSPRGWGTEITLDITGLPSRDGYQLWTIDATGTWVNAATWSPTPTGNVRLTGASRTPTNQIERIVITSSSREDRLVETAP